MNARPVTIPLGGNKNVSGLAQVPPRAFACCVLAHGAGAGMTHPFMTAVADGFQQRDVATLRFQFPYMENGSKRPDRPAVAHAAVRAAVAMAGDFRLPLFAGGKSFGARMTSQTQADTPLPDVLGLLFLGFPLHAAKQPSVQRADHLRDVHVPMLFLQGTRDALADTALLLPVVEAAGAKLNLVEAADHSFHVPKRSGRSDAEVLDDILDVAASWMRQVLARPEIFGQAQ